MVMKASGAAGANPASGRCARSFAGIASHFHGIGLRGGQRPYLLIFDDSLASLFANERSTW